MSSFICDKCGILNIDSDFGYIEGCRHYLPKEDGLYKVKFTNTSNSKVSFYFQKFKNREFVIEGFNNAKHNEQLVKWIRKDG